MDLNLVTVSSSNFLPEINSLASISAGANPEEFAKNPETKETDKKDIEDTSKISSKSLNLYCDENQLDSNSKLALFSTIQGQIAQEESSDDEDDENNEDIENKEDDKQIEEEKEKLEEEKERIEEERKEEEERKLNLKVIYAEEGDKDYDKNMDEDQDNVVTYEEYMRYCAEHNGDNQKIISKEQEEYLKTQNSEEDEETNSLVEVYA